MISIFDIFKIGIGPSSSHTIGPMKAGNQFVNDLISCNKLNSITKITVDVYGSLSLTGKGHHTDIAIIMGLAGNLPDSVDIDSIPAFIKNVEKTGKLELAKGQKVVDFPKKGGMVFHLTNLPLHENGMRISAWENDTIVFKKTYYSIGGGFIVDEENFGKDSASEVQIPYKYSSAQDILDICNKESISISSLILRNELAARSEQEVNDGVIRIWDTMKSCIKRGMETDGILSGPLRVPRRANALYNQLKDKENQKNTDPMLVIDWVNLFALAVNEENAAGGRVVTAPTNGACGIVPAVLAYYDKFIHPVGLEEAKKYFAAATAIGALYKMNASISGAEVGCQGEVGVACSMAAGALTEIMGGTPDQVCSAAEIGMEHHLGLTCDPVNGQVQVPCIERNAISAVKAINSSRMALSRTSSPCVSLDKVISTMYDTGKDMLPKYRETSQGGLALKILCS